MAGPSHSLISTSTALFPPSLPVQRSTYLSNPLFLKPLPKKFRVYACSSSTEPSNSLPTKGKNPLMAVLEIPVTIWRQTMKPLSDFGFGRRSVWEGGVGLFVVSGAVLLALSLAWLKAFHIRSKFRKYQTIFEFSNACGICMGTPVRIRGVTVGTVVGVNPSLKSIDAVVEVEDDKIIIPRNSLVEVNQSGLLMETMIDITPQEPLPSPSSVGPLDPDCLKEGLIICDRQRIVGQQGVSLDELVGIFTRLGREMDRIGVANTYHLAEKVAFAVEEAMPLLAKIEALTDDIQPLLSEVRDSGLLRDVENLTKCLTDASEDLRRVHSSMLTTENTELIRQSLSALIRTLKNIEGISSDISGFTGDEVTRHNLKLLIRSLSRLI
ncbi:hypothetical protein AMTRI_Chr08g162570 [Amborella trichopoda]